MVVVSAPGKVLLAGGYLILDRPHTGTVLALDARFFSAVEMRPPAAAALPGEVEVSVASPQFGELRHYVYSSGPAGEDASLRPTAGTAAQPPNRYVEVPLLYAITAARALAAAAAPAGSEPVPPPPPLALEVTLAADNGFYSHIAELRARGLPLTAESLASLPPLLRPAAGDNGDVAKTGLGSSATLVTSLVAALLHTLGAISLPEPGGPPAAAAAQPKSHEREERELAMLHALAQVCHCAAQGKVGSGFDVCAATFGSHRYCRFSPATIQPLLGLAEGAAPPPALLLGAIGSAGRAPALDHEAEPFQLPPGVEVMMADVCCGAHTPSMVKSIQRWRGEDGAAKGLWSRYASQSARLQASLRRLAALHGRYVADGRAAQWLEALARLGGMAPKEWFVEASLDGCELATALNEVRNASLELRTLVRSISTASGVPVEPAAQTRLLDATMQQRGVLMALVPGAGGHDAVLALVLPSAPPPAGLLATRQRVSSLWRGWDDKGADAAAAPVCELPVKESKSVSGGHNGVRIEGAAAAALLRRAAAPLRGETALSGGRQTLVVGLAAVVAVAAVAAAALQWRKR